MSNNASVFATLSETSSEDGTSESADGFAARLRESTRVVHREAERTGFIADLIRGRATRSGYVLFLRNLVPVYSALEQGIRSCPVDLVAGFSAPGLWRLDRLLHDLDAICGKDWSRAFPMLPEAGIYAAAIDHAKEKDPARLVAHAYARYLGDLSGGQILKPLLARSLRLEPDGLGFYDFPEVPDIAAQKAAIRDGLDKIDPSSGLADAIVAAAIAAFRHNIDLSLAVSRASMASID